MDLNRATIIGNVVRDPETRTTPSGQMVASLAVATNLIWKDKNGQRQQKAEFHNIVAWRRLGEIISQYVKKGSKIFIEGRLETRSWSDQNGTKRYRTEIIADNMILLDRAQGAAQPNQESETPDTAPAPEKEKEEGGEEEMRVEDIPF